MIRKTVGVLISFIFLISFSPGHAQDKMLSIHTGVSKAIGDGSEDWHLGFVVGVNGFFSVSQNIFFGGRIAFNRWTPNPARWNRNESWAEWEADGSATIIEIVPSLRLISPPKETQKINFFGQLGFGLFVLKMDATIKADENGSTFDAVFADQSESKMGISFGGGINLGKKGKTRIEILPLYHVIFTEGESTKYYSINIGIEL